MMILITYRLQFCCWRGLMECWIIGAMDIGKKTPLIQYSICMI